MKQLNAHECIVNKFFIHLLTCCFHVFLNIYFPSVSCGLSLVVCGLAVSNLFGIAVFTSHRVFKLVSFPSTLALPYQVPWLNHVLGYG